MWGNRDIFPPNMEIQNNIFWELGRMTLVTQILRLCLKSKMAKQICSIIFKPKNVFIRHFNKIVITNDGSTIVALHRDQGFPYEHSRPLPVEAKEDNTVLRISDISEVKRVFKDMKPEIARKQLSSLTLTTEHRWFPRARDKKAKKTEMNRPYL